MFDSVTPESTQDSSSNMIVEGQTMTGIPGLCDYSEWAAVKSPLSEGVEYVTSGNQFAWNCGYYV